MQVQKEIETVPEVKRPQYKRQEVIKIVPVQFCCVLCLFQLPLTIISRARFHQQKLHVLRTLDIIPSFNYERGASLNPNNKQDSTDN
jgi:hypothetical protein